MNTKFLVLDDKNKIGIHVLTISVNILMSAVSESLQRKKCQLDNYRAYPLFQEDVPRSQTFS